MSEVFTKSVDCFLQRHVKLRQTLRDDQALRLSLSLSLSLSHTETNDDC